MRPKICIVDDNPEIRSSLENFLRAAGIMVRTFGSADHFLDTYPTGEIDCLITDIQMPGMDGLELQAELNRRGRGFPVVVVTGYPEPGIESDCRTLGAAAFFTKPVDPEMLLECLEDLTETRGA